MCCFSRPVQSVTATRIYARSFPAGPERERQHVIYSMHLKADEELAMVLPLPAKPKAGEDAVRFLNLENYPNFFVELERGFPPPANWSFGCEAKMASPSALPVQEVGSFEASFVPTIADFSRVDARFRLPEGTWEKLPQYKSYGFAVFKLKPGAKTIHPMSFSFPRANARQLFFPTVHIHDGEVHPKADFDHLLYCQRNPDEKFRLWSWRESPQPAKNFVNVAKAKDAVDGSQHCFRLELTGHLKNEDTVVG